MDLFDHYLQIILLGIVEGVTEFLPVSSTGHLLIAEHLVGVAQPEVFNVVVRSGTILALILAYWGKLGDMVGSLERPASRGTLMRVAGAFCLAGALGFALTQRYHLQFPETLTPVAWATLIGGIVILLIEFLAKNLYPHEDVSWPEAILIGLSQIVAGIFPGTSRTGVTIITGLAMGMKRPAATEFSFLVGIPTMIFASGMELVMDHKDLVSGGRQLLLDSALGFLTSAIVAFFVIQWLLRFVQTHSFNGFAIYRILLGGALLIALHSHAIPELGAAEPKPASVETVTPVNPTPMPTPQVAPTPATNAAVAPVVPAVPDTSASAPAVTNIIDSSSDSTTTILAPPTPTAASQSVTNPHPATTLQTNAPASTTAPLLNVPAH